MGTLTKANPNARELLTEILDKTRWWVTLRRIVDFLSSKRVERIRIEFGVVLGRDPEGKSRAQHQIVQLGDLEGFIKNGFDEGTIEWAKASDFLFQPLGTELVFMLCNDADLHSPLLIHRCSWNSGTKSAQAESRSTTSGGSSDSGW